MPWEKGQSGNPSGRPKLVAEIRELAQSMCVEAIHKLAFLMRESDDERIQQESAKELLNRGLGKAHQSIEVSGEVASFVALIPISEEASALWMEQQKRIRAGQSSGSLSLDLKPSS